jgi:Flp pilus assembly CpaF family ATPase
MSSGRVHHYRTPYTGRQRAAASLSRISAQNARQVNADGREVDESCPTQAAREPISIQAIEKLAPAIRIFSPRSLPAQKSGLKDATRKLAKADSDLDKQSRTFDQIVHSPKPESEQLANSAANLDKALASFQSEQLALGKK